VSIKPALIAPFLMKPAVPLALDFKSGIYRRNGVIVPSGVLGLAGATHARSGSCWEMAPDGSLVAFAPNQPRIVPGLGLWARGAFTNLLLRSQEMENGSWIRNGGGTGFSPVITANAGTAPDGSTTADRVVLNKGAGTSLNDFSNVQQNITSTAVAHNESIWLRSESGPVQVGLRIIGNVGGVIDREIITVTDQWQRFTISRTFTTTTNGLQIVLRGTYGTSDQASLLVWQGDVFTGSQPGPMIPTSGGTASTGADIHTIPFVQRDEDFTLLVAFNLAEGIVSGTTKVPVMFSDGTPSNRFGLVLSGSGATDWRVTTAGTARHHASVPAGLVTSGRAVFAMRYRAGKLTLANKIGSNAPALASEGAVIPFPIGLARIDIGHHISTSPFNGVVEVVEVQRGPHHDNTWLAAQMNRLAA